MLLMPPLKLGFTYLTLGGLFLYFAIDNVSKVGWTFFTYLCALFATMNIVSSFRFFILHIAIKRRQDAEKD